MRSLALRTLVAAASSFAAVGHAQVPDAGAEAPISTCLEGSVFPASGNVPANVATILWANANPAQTLKLYLVNGGQHAEVPTNNTYDGVFGYRVRAKTPFVAGDRVAIELTGTCADTSAVTAYEISITEAAPLPTSLEGVTVRAVEVEYDDLYPGGVVPRERTRLEAELVYTPPPVLYPFVDVLAFKVDAYEYGLITYMLHEPFEPGDTITKRPYVPTYGSCDELAGSPATVEVGGTLTAFFPSGELVHSDRASLTVRCRDDAAGASMADERDADVDATTDAGAASAPTVATTSPDSAADTPAIDASGCSALPGAVRRLSGWLLLFGALLVALFIVRRRERS